VRDHSESFPGYDLREGLMFASLGTCHEGMEMRVVRPDGDGGV